ncbi:MAG: protein TolQ [Proteobacteria bacterium]|nr:MAG: protein TolQ [Pseudomonadota bacterium]
MNLTQDLSLIALIANASFVVKLVLGLLIGMSLMSWWFIFRKAFVLREARRKAEDFERTFWSGSDLNSLFQAIVSSRRSSGSMERIFEAGFREFVKLRKQTTLAVTVVMDGTRRAMRAAYHREVDYLDSHLSFLATVGSVSPYIGLLGTVWGIMNAFRGLANVHQATLAQVAPGIAEALVATAIGLFAAIPAVVAFNYYSRGIDSLTIRFETFMEEFSNILQRQGGGT